MYVRDIEVKNFRNYTAGAAGFCQGLNVMQGQNAQGKTNLLEAIYLCCIGKSPRVARDKDLIRWGSGGAKITLTVIKREGSVKIEIYFSEKENKRILINGLPIMRIGELMGALNCVFFSPDELKIVKESPSDRRRFMDIDISQMSKTYFYLLNRYNKILSQRNKLLKTGNESVMKETLPVWDIQLVNTGAKIIVSRKRFIEKLRPFVSDEHKYLTGGKEDLEIAYDGVGGETVTDICKNFINELKAAEKTDLKNGFTSVGPHKDDFSLKSGGVDLRVFGSQGQQRTAALALKLAELEIFAGEIGEYPVLLLDDVLSELDLSRQSQLIKRIGRVQTILTCTHLSADFDIVGKKVFNIKEGRIY